MKDAYVVSGEKITYKNDEYVIGNFYFVPNNPSLFVQLKKNGCSLNVRLEDIQNLITSIQKPFFMIKDGNTL
jgi:hypothetical protein